MQPSHSRFKSFIYASQMAGLLTRWTVRRGLSWTGLEWDDGPHGVWLTFDDGPHPEHTPRILNALAKYGVRATFFVIGERAERHPQILERMVREGHRLGNHSYSHLWMTQLDLDAIGWEIGQTDAILSAVQPSSRYHDRVFRPPHGARNDLVDAAARVLGYRTVLWNASTRDYHPKYQPDRWVRTGHMMVNLNPQAVVLMHDDLPGTAAHLEAFLGRLRRMPDLHWMPPKELPQLSS